MRNQPSALIMSAEGFYQIGLDPEGFPVGQVEWLLKPSRKVWSRLQRKPLGSFVLGTSLWMNTRLVVSSVSAAVKWI
jgi:hypothetical protein